MGLYRWNEERNVVLIDGFEERHKKHSSYKDILYVSAMLQPYECESFYGGHMQQYFQWLKSLIFDLSCDTIDEDLWSIEYLDEEGKHQTMGNSRKIIRTGFWVGFWDHEARAFAMIREQLEGAQKILKVSRAGRNSLGTEQLRAEHRDAFRFDEMIEGPHTMAVLLDREDNILEKMSLLDATQFANRFALPVRALAFSHIPMAQTEQFVLLDDGFIARVSSRVEH